MDSIIQKGGHIFVRNRSSLQRCCVYCIYGTENRGKCQRLQDNQTFYIQKFIKKDIKLIKSDSKYICNIFRFQINAILLNFVFLKHS